jgi:hypothetical protein
MRQHARAQELKHEHVTVLAARVVRLVRKCGVHHDCFSIRPVLPLSTYLRVFMRAREQK